MDLSVIINKEAPESSAQKSATPIITPIQVVVPQPGFQDFHPHPASAKRQSQDFGHRGSDPYVSPPSYQGGGPHSRPAAPPPLQPPSHSDRQSPVGSQYSAQSQYLRNTPSSSVSSNQYPFAPNQTPQSPAPPHPYPHTFQHRDSYPYSYTAQSQPQNQQQPGYGQSASNTPVGTPGSANPYFSQQSGPSLQNSAPTSAHGQQPYYNPYLYESPVSASAYPPNSQLPQHKRQSSLPQTPLGPPTPNPRQNSDGYPQPTSPYQQRPLSSGTINPPNPQIRGPPQHSSQQLIRHLNSDTTHDSRPASALASNPRPQTAIRERSPSVSPKSQLPTLPMVDMATNQSQQAQNGPFVTPKRKFDDETVSGHVPASQVTGGGQPVDSPTPPPQPARKRRRYNEPPIWAQSFAKHAREIAARENGIPPRTKLPVNGGQQERSVKLEPPNGHQQMTPAAARPPQVDFRSEGLLGPWEPSITGIRPFEEIPKLVADWLFHQVVTRADAGELASRGVEIEIEAKLGQLINRESNERFYLPVLSECILADSRQLTFKSSMTEAQHKSLNDFLNAKVKETHPDNPSKTKPRVPILYAHRRERDTFYELPPSAQAALPASIRKELNPRHTVKVRVTHDQKTGQLLAKIIKTRVADLDLYNPRFPLDCRISVNLEMRYDGDMESLIATADTSRMPDRKKDRLSYTQSHYQIDLTQVTVDDGSSREKEHELEIELSAAAVREQGRRALAGEPHQYGELIEGLMDNVRVLTRNVPDHSATLA